MIKTSHTLPYIPPIHINNHNIKISPYAKNLEIIIDNKLTFSQHTTEIYKSVNRTLHTIGLIRPSITTELAKTLITALILPRLDYCNSILHKYNKNTIIPLNRLLYSAARIIYRIPKYSRTHITPYLKSLHWLPITQRIQYQILLMIHHATYYNNPTI